MPFKPDEREYRALAGVLKPPEQEGHKKRLESDYYVEGYATTFGDRYLLGVQKGVEYFEMVEARAFDECDLSDVIMQFDHQGTVLARAGNKSLLLEADQRGLFVAADLGRSSAAKAHYEEIQSGLITQMSFGFRVASDGAYFDKKTNTRVITKFEKVFDVSSVAIPANASTTISARSMLEGSTEAWTQELRGQERKRLSIILDIMTGGQ